MIGAITVVLVGLLPPTLLREFDLPAEIRGWISPVFVSIAMVTALVVVVRLSLVLPAAAVGDFTMTLRKSWVTTRGSSWPILAGSVLTSGPSIAANIALNGVAEWIPQASGGAAVIVGAMVLSMGLAILAAVFEASFLSYAYLFFVGERAPAAAAEGQA